MLTNLLIFFIHVCQVVELPLSHNRAWTDSTTVEMWTGYLAFHYRATGVQSTHRRPESSTSTCHFKGSSVSNTQGSSIVQGALPHEKWLEGPSLRCHSSQGNTNSQLKTNACCGECMLLFQRYWTKILKDLPNPASNASQ